MNLQYLLRVGSPLAALLPRRQAEWLADRIGDAAWKLAPRQRDVLAHNLALVLGSGTPNQATRGGFRTYARYFLAAMRLAHRGLGPAVGHLRWQGDGRLASSLERGRGVVLLSAHLGNWDVLGAALAARFGFVCVAVEKLQPVAVFDFYTRMRRQHGVVVAPVGDPGRAPVETLRRNGILGVVADRPFGRRHEEVACGGAIIAVPSGAIRLALRHGAAIHTGFARREAGGFELCIGPDWGPELQAMAAEPARLQRAASLFAAALREAVGRDPGQWCLFHRLGAGAAAAARDAA